MADVRARIEVVHRPDAVPYAKLRGGAPEKDCELADVVVPFHIRHLQVPHALALTERIVDEAGKTLVRGHHANTTVVFVALAKPRMPASDKERRIRRLELAFVRQIEVRRDIHAGQTFIDDLLHAIAVADHVAAHLRVQGRAGGESAHGLDHARPHPGSVSVVFLTCLQLAPGVIRTGIRLFHGFLDDCVRRQRSIARKNFFRKRVGNGTCRGGLQRQQQANPMRGKQACNYLQFHDRSFPSRHPA